MLKNVAGQNITAVLLDTAGAVVTTGTTTVYVLGDAGTQASMGTATHEGNGAWSIDVTQAESNYDDIGFTWVNTGAVTVHQHVFTDATYDRIGSTGSGLTSLATASALTTVDNEIAAIDTVVDAILVDTGTTLPASIATIDSNVDLILADTSTDGVVISMSQSLPGTPTSDTVGDALKQATREEKAKKNVALSNIAFKMVSSSDNKTGVASLSATVSPQTLTIQYAQDGASAWTIGAGTVVEVGDGIYKYNATQAEMNADTIIFRFAGAGANSTEIAITTVA